MLVYTLPYKNLYRLKINIKIEFIKY
jgi:hypothetical protein